MDLCFPDANSYDCFTGLLESGDKVHHEFFKSPLNKGGTTTKRRDEKLSSSQII